MDKLTVEILVGITIIILLISLFFDRAKTIVGVKKGIKMFLGILPDIVNVLILVSVFLYLFPNETLVKILGKESGTIGIGIAALIGSISLIPGFIACPLAGILLKSGVTYKVIAVFVTTLMMVGIFTLPLEVKYFGYKISFMRRKR